MTERLRSTAVAPLLAALLLLTSLLAPRSEPSTRVLVGAGGAVADAAAAVVEAGGAIVDRFDGLGVLVADVHDPEALLADPRVTAVERDRAIDPQGRDDRRGRGGDADLPPPSTSAGATIRADELWDAGVTGEGVGIAVIDTGISRSRVTRGALAAGVDTSGERTRGVRDGFGHGTFVAALAAGAPDARTGFSGIAPDAHLVSIKVADRDGNATLSSVMAGIAAADRAREVLDVRVVLLAAGGPDIEGVDLLELALRQLWARGLVVVVPSGNQGGTVASPGVDPYLLTVGALDDRGTEDRSDDTVPEWSGSHDGGKPDVLAPGVSLVSARSHGSQVDRDHRGSRIGPHHFRGSGTSMAAGVTAGAAALLLQAHPDLGPDEVKGRLAGTADGGLDVAAATAAGDGLVANAGLEAIDLWEAPSSDQDSDDRDWEGNSWVGNSWVGNSWVGNSWVGNSWVGNSWVGNSWVGNSWVGNSWVGSNWQSSSWGPDRSTPAAFAPRVTPYGNSWV